MNPIGILRAVREAPRTVATALGDAVGATVGSTLDRVNPGRRHRRVWVADGRAHIEIRSVGRPGQEHVARHVEKALRDVEGVHWAQVNAVVGRVVVVFDPEGVDTDDLLGVIEGVEDAHDVHEERFSHTEPEHPGDFEPIRRNLIAIGADVAGLGAGVVGQLLRFSPFPTELASIVSLAESEPRVRHFLENHLGVPATDLGLGLSNAFVQAISQGPLGLVVDITNRANVASELRARRSTFTRRELELCHENSEPLLEAVSHEPRPLPLPSGPVERYADRAAFASLGAFGVILGTTRSPRRAAGTLVAGLPKAARLGREAFAAHLGRELARRDVIVMDGAVMRRLDRMDTVVLDAATVMTGRATVVAVEVVHNGASDMATIQAKVSSLFDPQQPGRIVRRGGWALGPLCELRAQSVTMPRGVTSQAKALAGAHGATIGIAHKGTVVGLAAVEAEIDPLAEIVSRAARRGGLGLVVAEGHSHSGGGVGEQLGADRVVAGGNRLAASVLALQQEGKGVILISGGHAHAALRAADCAIGLPGEGRPHPWSADFVTSAGLVDAYRIIEAVPVARQVSSRSSLVALAGSGVGGAWSMFGPAATAARRAALPVNVAALLAQGQGLLSAAELGRRSVPTPASRTPWHTLEAGAVLSALSTTAQGLDSLEARRRQEHRVTRPPRVLQMAHAIGAELANPLTPVMAVGAGLAAAVGSTTDAALVAGVTGANALVGGVQRMRAEVSIQRLLQVGEMVVQVRRAGLVTTVEREQLVRGDVIELFAGDVVPADCRILEADSCELDESALTGESLPVVKTATPVVGASVADRSCMLYEGTTVANGSALAVVVALGAETEVGQSLADAPSPPESGVEARLSMLTKVMVPAVVASGGAVTGLSLLRGHSMRRAVTSGVSLMVAAVPEGLPLLATVAQLASARRLSERGALVRNPRTIEALGRVDTLCFDKTGTLTAGEISLQRVSDGIVDESVDSLGPPARRVLAAALRASPEADGNETSLLPHATDRAVLEGATNVGVTPGEGLGDWIVLGELAFDSARGFHAVVGTSPEGPRVSVKGAPEVILPRCSTWASSKGTARLDRRVRSRLEAEVDRLAHRGLRVLAVAERPATTQAEIADERIANMVLLGFLGLADSVRPTAARAVSDIRAAGVEVVMITGDHPGTATSIANELAILNGNRVLTGVELDTLGDPALDEVLPSVSVFARVTPTHKVRIVRAYQRIGRVVAMTGDGANDAPAIRLANTGIALAGRGSPAAREAADMVVVDDRIETILDAIVEGRAMWASVRDALAILIGGNLGEVGFTLAATAIAGEAPLDARQFLLVNLLTDMLPAMTIALRPPTNRSPEFLLHEGPDASLGSALAQQVVLRALTTAGGATGAWLVARASGTRRRASTVALVALVGTQLGQTALVGGTSPVVLGSTVVSAAALVGIVQTPGASQFFGCTPLGPLGWSIATGAAATATGASVILPWALERVRAT
jgi:cation-transporting ATPase I